MSCSRSRAVSLEVVEREHGVDQPGTPLPTTSGAGGVAPARRRSAGLLALAGPSSRRLVPHSARSSGIPSRAKGGPSVWVPLGTSHAQARPGGSHDHGAVPNTELSGSRCCDLSG